MISVKIFYIFMLIGIFIFYIMYIDVISFVMLMFVLIMPVVTWILFWISRKKLDVSLRSSSMNVSKNDAIILNLIVNNKSFIPISRVDITISYKNDFLGVWDNYVVSTFARANNTQKLSSVIKPEFCGGVTAKIESIVVYDLLLLHKKKFKARKLNASKTTVNSLVFPDISEIDLEVNIANTVDYESEYMSKTQKGDDPSEIFDIHEYAPGDKLNRIHWKISAKSEETYVKDFSLPIANNTCLLFDSKIKISNANEIFKALTTFDICLEAIFSFSYCLCEKEVIHNVVYFDRITNEFSRNTITDIDECRYAVSELLKAKGTPSEQSVICDYLSSEYNGKQKIVYFTSCISKNELEFISENTISDITVICADEIDFDCYPVPDGINLFIIKDNNISKSIEQLKF